MAGRRAPVGPYMGLTDYAPSIIATVAFRTTVTREFECRFQDLGPDAVASLVSGKP